MTPHEHLVGMGIRLPDEGQARRTAEEGRGGLMIQVKREGGDRKPPCHLTGTDGNAFAVIGRVREVLRAAGQAGKAVEFTSRAFAAGSYDAVLRLCFEYVEVE